MIQNVLRSIGGIENYGVISITLFFVCFLGIVGWAFCLRKPFLDNMASLPLDEDHETAESQKTSDDLV